jgi:hypothetical protein
VYAATAICVALLSGCGRLGFDPEEAQEVVINQSTIGVSAPTVTTCNRVLITLTSRDQGGEVIPAGGDRVELALADGTNAGVRSPITDHGDGTYSALFTGMLAGSPVEVVATVNGEMVEERALLQVEDELVPTNGLLFMLDAARSGGAGACVEPAGSGWTDVIGDRAGTFVGIADPSCGADSGWCGIGLVDDPFRLTFDGTDDFVDFGADVATSEFTVAAWIRPHAGGVITSTGTGGINLIPIVAKGAPDVEVLDKDTNYVIGLAATGAVGTDFERDPDSLNMPQIGSLPVANDAWHHVAVAYDRAVRRIYVDGALDQQMPLTDTPSASTLSRLCIGTERKFDLTTRGQFRGDIAIVQIYDHALAGTEIRDACRSEARRFAGASCP